MSVMILGSNRGSSSVEYDISPPITADAAKQNVPMIVEEIDERTDSIGE